MWFSKDTISNYWPEQKLAVGEAVGYRHSQGTPTGQIIFAGLHMNYLSTQSFLSIIPISLSSCLPMPPSQALLMVVVFCKTHLVAGKKNKYIPCYSNPTQHTNSTRYNRALLSFQYLTSLLHTRLVESEFFICAPKPTQQCFIQVDMQI